MPTYKRIILVKLSFIGLLITALFSYLLILFIFSEEIFPEEFFPVLASTETTSEVKFTTPVRLLIPAIKVKAKVQTVGLVPNGVSEMSVPDNFTDVGWYGLGTLPGQPGSAVMVGHLNGKGVTEAVFYDLDQLVKGDQVIVSDRFGQLLIFTVVAVKIYDFDAPTQDIFLGDKSKVRLNLITCSGDWLVEKKLYDKRTVVFTELI